MKSMSITRRNIVATAVLVSASVGLGVPGRAQGPMSMHMDHDEEGPKRPKVPRLPAILCRSAGTTVIDTAYRRLQQGADTLDAVLEITRAQEDNPNDITTGLGGLPDEDGVVQLDACCFHGPSRRSGAVTSLSDIRNASLVARSVMEKTGYPLLTGVDAQRFATSQGFSSELLTTDRTRKIWALWKQVQATPLPPGPIRRDPERYRSDRRPRFLPASQDEFDVLVNRYAEAAARLGIEPQWIWGAADAAMFPVAAPLYASAVSAKNEMSCAATTSGLPWRQAGASSDVAIPGAGCYLDPEVGSAGASGNAEANIRIAGSSLIVDNMRKGLSPEDAGMDALRRIAAWYRHDMATLRFVEIVYYILRKDGAYACVSLWHGDTTNHVRTYVVHDGLRRSEECLFLFDGSPLTAV